MMPDSPLRPQERPCSLHPPPEQILSHAFPGNHALSSPLMGPPCHICGLEPDFTDAALCRHRPGPALPIRLLPEGGWVRTGCLVLRGTHLEVVQRLHLHD